MTLEEYIKKKNLYASSSAPIEIKEKAIKELDEQYIKNKKLIQSSLVETSEDKDYE
jgi:uncharacterized protein (DUF1919 family)